MISEDDRALMTAVMIAAEGGVDFNMILPAVEDFSSWLDLGFPGEQDERDRKPQEDGFYEATIPHYTPDDFRLHFGMKRETMDILVNSVGERWREMNHIVPLEKKILLTVSTFIKAESFLAAGKRFGLATSTAHAVFCEVMSTISSMLDSFVQWPNEPQIQVTENVFREWSGGIPGIVGLIDGCHIRIKQPEGKRKGFAERKGFHSVVLQAVCDERGKFTDVYIGESGRTHAAQVFRNSPLCDNMVNGNLILPDRHIIGGTAYPVLRNMITPFNDIGYLTGLQARFNTRVKAIRTVVKRAFALLRGKFKKLKYLEMTNMPLVNSVIAASCVLHNLILTHETPLEEEYAQDEPEEEIYNYDFDIIGMDYAQQQEGIAKRDIITTMI